MLIVLNPPLEIEFRSMSKWSSASHAPSVLNVIALKMEFSCKAWLLFIVLTTCRHFSPLNVLAVNDDIERCLWQKPSSIFYFISVYIYDKYFIWLLLHVRVTLSRFHPSFPLHSIRFYIFALTTVSISIWERESENQLGLPRVTETSNN